jgi:hypothetical protein
VPDSGARSGAVSGQLNNGISRVASVVFHVGHGISLGSPISRANERTEKFRFLTDAGDKGAGFAIDWNEDTYSGGNTGAKVEWPIVQNGSNTEYTLTARIGFGNRRGANDFPLGQVCTVSGPNGQSAGHFHCSMTERGRDNAWDLSVTDDRVDRRAEVSGSITTDSRVSLTAGEFVTQSRQARQDQLRVDGAAEVPSNSSTQFDSVLRPQDTTLIPDRALMAFMHAILEDGKPAYSKDDGTRLYVRGNVKNKRSQGLMGDWFSPESSCDIISEKNHIDKNSGYSCDMKGDFVRNGNRDGDVHYHTDFTVKKR